MSSPYTRKDSETKKMSSLDTSVTSSFIESGKCHDNKENKEISSEIFSVKSFMDQPFINN